MGTSTLQYKHPYKQGNMLLVWRVWVVCVILAVMVTCKARTPHNLQPPEYYTISDNIHNINPSVRDLSGGGSSKDLSDLASALLDEYSSPDYPLYKLPLNYKQKKGQAGRRRSSHTYDKRNMGVDLSDILRRDNKNLLRMIQ